MRLVEIEPNELSGEAPFRPESNRQTMPYFDGATVDVSELASGEVHADAGRAAYGWLCRGVDLSLAGTIDGIVTLPLHKEGLAAAGLPYPGHTEILAERTGAPSHAMMLYRRGVGVVHVTLHTSLSSVPGLVTTEANLAAIRLADDLLARLHDRRPRLVVAALNPHASDGGLFGDEEEQIIRPAVDQARNEGIDVVGPVPADAAFVRANEGEFDGVVAQYHDQGHIALKLLGWREAVNVTAGLPIVRTSVAHGTAYDLVGKAAADPASVFEAVRAAAKLCRSRASNPQAAAKAENS